MKKVAKLQTGQFLNREHLLVIVGTLIVSLHVVDDLARLGDPFPPPYIPLLVATAIYSFLPLIVRALVAVIFGVVFSIAQIFGHITPLLERPLGGSDNTGFIGLIGGVILISVGLKLLKRHFVQK